MDKYGYIGIETLLNFCENSKDHAVTPNDFMRMNRVRIPERKKGKWNTYYHSVSDFSHSCNQCGYSAPYQMIGSKVFQKKWNFCPNCGADMRGDQNETD